ncbi:MAG: trypsin-like peptidase domain-containing protein [Candidatus Promineifilaceae bacterium]
MRSLALKTLILPIIALTLLLSACSQSADDSTPAPAATIDTDEIAAAVLSEVEAQIDALTTSESVASETGPEASMESVMEQVEVYLAEREEPAPVALVNPEDQEEDLDLEAVLINLYRKTNPAVVYIIVPPIGSGSGFVYNDDGYIVTNNHVVEIGSNYEVVFSSGERLSADLVGRDVDSDLAVIKVNQLPSRVKPLALASSSELSVGQFVIAIGNPFGEQGSMSLGIVSGLNRSLSSQHDSSTGSSYSLPQVIQTDAPINPGNSGGPLLNLDGEVVGVNSAIASTTGTNSGVGFSIPSDAVMRIVPSLIEDGSYDYPYMGASFDGEISLSDQSDYGLSQTQGAYVSDITVGGPSDEAGLIPADPISLRGGDLIVDIDGIPIKDFSDLNSYLVFQTVAGQTIDITVLRGDEKLVIKLTLGSRSAN